jgi:hypothetical protein
MFGGGVFCVSPLAAPPIYQAFFLAVTPFGSTFFAFIFL